MRRLGVVAIAALALVAACTADDDDDDAGGGESSDTTALGDADPGDCIVVEMAVSSEKITLLTELAEEFNRPTVPRSASAACSCVHAAWPPGSPPR